MEKKVLASQNSKLGSALRVPVAFQCKGSGGLNPRRPNVEGINKCLENSRLLRPSWQLWRSQAQPWPSMAVAAITAATMAATMAAITAATMAATATGKVVTATLIGTISTGTTAIGMATPGAAAMAAGGADIGTPMASARAGGWCRVAGSGFATRF